MPIAIHKFDHFAALYASLPLTSCGYKPSEVQSAKSEDMQSYYSKEEQAKYGVIGIEMELLPWRDTGLTQISRCISMLLRHKPHVAGLTLDEYGWANYATAVTVGTRHGKPVIYRVDTKQMYADGFRFYKSVNNVWLTKYVPAYYLKKQ